MPKNETASRGRVPQAMAMRAIQSAFWEWCFGDDTIRGVPDGEEGWAFYIHEDDPSSYVHWDGGGDVVVLCGGTQWDPVRQWRSEQDERDDADALTRFRVALERIAKGDVASVGEYARRVLEGGAAEEPTP